MTDYNAQARGIVDRWVNRFSSTDELSEEATTTLMTNITAALREAEARGLETAAHYLGEHAHPAPHIGPLWNVGWNNAAIGFANWCRQEAQRVREAGG